jgi:hypothetical protein
MEVDMKAKQKHTAIFLLMAVALWFFTPTQCYNITQSPIPDDGHMVARNMLSN